MPTLSLFLDAASAHYGGVQTVPAQVRYMTVRDGESVVIPADRGQKK